MANKKQKLDGIQDLVTNPKSPLLAELQKELAKFENEPGMTEQKYQQIAMQKLIEKLQKHASTGTDMQLEEPMPSGLGGDPAEMGKPVNKIDLNRPPAPVNRIDGNATLTEQAPNRIDLTPDAMRQASVNKIDLNPRPLPVPQQPPALPAPQVAAIKMPPIRVAGGAPATEDEQLSESMLQALYGLAKTASGATLPDGDDPMGAQTLDEHDMSGVDKLPSALTYPVQDVRDPYSQPRTVSMPLTERPEDEAILRKALAALQEQYR